MMLTASLIANVILIIAVKYLISQVKYYSDDYLDLWERHQVTKRAVQAYYDARMRVYGSFGHRSADGQCQCVYCTKDFEGVATAACNYELDLFSAERKIEGYEKALHSIADPLCNGCGCDHGAECCAFEAFCPECIAFKALTPWWKRNSYVTPDEADAYMGSR